jgi:CRP/FNR family transcriptional regulator
VTSNLALRLLAPSSGFARRAPARCPTLCATCGLRGMCLPCALPQDELHELDGLVYARRRVRRGEHVYRAGDPFRSLFAFRTGFYKSYVAAADGRTQVTGFQMAGDVVGLDGIEADRHVLSIAALEDGEVCVIPYAHIESLSARVPGFAHHIHRTMSREIVREQGIMAMLGSMRAEARVAAFLLGLSQRFAARGYSSTEFNLRMTRDEIGSYLGLKLETVSRILSKFQSARLISAQLRYVRIVDAAGLSALLGEG